MNAFFKRSAVALLVVALSTIAIAESPDASTDSFRPVNITVPDGFEVELVAGPPLVKFPMMASFDNQGRLYVAESSGENLRAPDLEKQLPNYVRRLEDTDGDGRFDRSTIFADKMTLPQGTLWYDNSLYVASPPNIWRLEDTDDDGVADRREILVDSFGYTGNAASVHGCFLGPSGRIYWCDGRHGHEFHDEEGKVTSKKSGSYIFSCRPDGSDVRVHCGGGMDNPVEVDFTEDGEIIGSVNILYSRPREDCLVHWLYGGTYPHSERVLGEFKRTGDLLGPIHSFGHVAVSGMTRYRSGSLDRSFQDNLFVTIFNEGKVQRCITEPDGATFRVQQNEFLDSENPDFHPTDVLEDADGSLLVIDTGGWFRIGCPTSQIAKPQVKGAIYRVRRKSQEPIEDPWGRKIQWDEIPARQLVALLGDSRFQVRERAIAECAAQFDGRPFEILAALADSPNADPRTRRNIVWALARINLEPTRERLRMALKDEDASVRLAACNALAANPDEKASPILRVLIQTDQPSVRRNAAKALGRAKDVAAVPVLLAGLPDADVSETHSRIYALIEVNDPDATRSGLKAVEPEVIRGALIALDQMDSGNLTQDEVMELVRSEHAAVRTAALDIAARKKVDGSAVVALLAEWFDSPQRASEQKAQLVQIVAAFSANQQVMQAIGEALQSKGSSNEIKIHLLNGIETGLSVHPEPKLVAALEDLLSKETPRDVVLAALAACQSVTSDPWGERITDIAADRMRDSAVRLAAIEYISQKRKRLEEPLFEFLLETLQSSSDIQARNQASQIVSQGSYSDEQLIQLSRLIPDVGPIALIDLVQPFAKNQKEPVAKAFLSAIQNARSLQSVPFSAVSDVVKRYPESLLPAANEILATLRKQDQERQWKLESLLKSMTHADPNRGAAIFKSEKAKCATCHQLGEKGIPIGPSLAQVGRRRNHRDLLEAILFPSKSIVREYENFAVLTDDGRTLTGMIVNENDTTLVLQQQTGAPVVIAKANIEELRPSSVSLMPSGLDQNLSNQELVDLLSFLANLK